MLPKLDSQGNSGLSISVFSPTDSHLGLKYLFDLQDGWTSDDAKVFNRLWGRQTPKDPISKVNGPAILVANKLDISGGLSLLHELSLIGIAGCHHEHHASA